MGWEQRKETRNVQPAVLPQSGAAGGAGAGGASNHIGSTDETEPVGQNSTAGQHAHLKAVDEDED